MRHRKTANPKIVHNRIAADAPHSDVVLVEVDDPYEAGGRVVVLRSIRHDILAQMRAKGLDEARYAAGRKFEQCCEDAQLTVQACDPTREPVDGGKFPDPLPDRRASALMALRAAKGKLGQDGYNLTYLVLGRGLSLVQVSASQWGARMASARFHDCLESLALLWGYTTCWRRRS